MKHFLYILHFFIFYYYNKTEVNIYPYSCKEHHYNTQHFSIHDFHIAIDEKKIIVTNNQNKTLLETTGNFLRAGYSMINDDLITNGNYNNKEKILYQTTNFHIDQNIDQNTRSIDKKFVNVRGNIWSKTINASYTIHFYLHSKNQLAFDITVTEITGIINKLFFTYKCEADETFHGFGTQYTLWNVKGKRVPIVVSEQGVGRGKQPLTAIVNMYEKGAGGDWTSSYAPKPLYITNYNRSIVFENNEIMHFDFRRPKKVVVELIGRQYHGRIINAPSVLDIVSEITLHTGRMKPLPLWTQQGAIVGLQGGNKVDHIVHRLLENKIKITGIWLQDWVGIKHALEGDRLCWCWTLNHSHYDNWKQMTSGWFLEHGIRTLSYINPYFSIYHDNILYHEGIKHDFFIKNRENQPYPIQSGSIQFHMIDLTNPEARTWIKNIIKKNMVSNTGVYGWMSDFGEHVPIDANLFQGNALDYHNLFPLEWAKINKEAIDEIQDEPKRETKDEPKRETKRERKYKTKKNELLFFMRSASLQSSKYTQLYWLGDQMVTWDHYDGIKTVLTGYLSSGISGHSLTHSDIGGYTQFPFFFTRTKELLLRWIEFSAFGSAIFRTHMGSNLSDKNKQIYNDPDITQHFSRFVDIFVNLKEYRYTLMKEAEQYGYPLMRPMSAHYNDCWHISDQYLFGPDILVKPVLDYNVRKTKVFLPKDTVWIHVWSNKTWEGTNKNILIDVPLGQPAVFYNIKKKDYFATLFE